MLRSLKALEHYTVRASDGDIGHVANFLLDDERWYIRYLVVKTTGLFEGSYVLVSPIAFRKVNWATKTFELALTKDKVRGSPGEDEDKPVSRQHEWDYNEYHQHPHYWEVPSIWGGVARPQLVATGSAESAPAEPSADIHLRSVKELRGYHIQGSDQEIGHVADFIVDDERWAVRYLVVDTSNWWLGKKVLIAPHWATAVSWAEKKVHLNLSRETIKKSPEWDACAAVNREYEVRLYDYFGRPAYWDSGEERVEAPPLAREVEPE